MTTRVARLLAAFNRDVKRARDAYNADQSVALGYCAQCHTRRRRSPQRRCWMCANGGPDQAAVSTAAQATEGGEAMNPDDDHRPACAGTPLLFESTHAADHIQARAICLACPLRAWCDGERRKAEAASFDGGRIQGTWAGVLYGAKEGALRQLREEQAFTDDEAKACHTAFYHGDRTPRIRAGERVYQRRVKRKQVAA